MIVIVLVVAIVTGLLAIRASTHRRRWVQMGPGRVPVDGSMDLNGLCFTLGYLWNIYCYGCYGMCMEWYGMSMECPPVDVWMWKSPPFEDPFLNAFPHRFSTCFFCMFTPGSFSRDYCPKVCFFFWFIPAYSGQQQPWRAIIRLVFEIGTPLLQWLAMNIRFCMCAIKMGQ